PTLVVTAAHDPAGFREIGPLVAREAPDARNVELDSDHYVTLREPELLAGVLLEFLTAAAPEEERTAGDEECGPSAGPAPDPGPRETAGRIRDLPAAHRDVQPRAPAAPVDGERPVVVAQRERDVVEALVRRQVDAVRNAANRVECVDERHARRLLVERVD